MKCASALTIINEVCFLLGKNNRETQNLTAPMPIPFIAGRKTSNQNL